MHRNRKPWCVRHRAISHWTSGLGPCLATLGLGLATLGLGWTRPALAQPSPTPQETTAAADDATYERLILSALEAYERGQWAKALREFERAHDLKPSARTLRTIGMAAYNLGDYPRAIASLEQATEDPRRPLNAAQRTEARQLVQQANREVARVSLRVTPPPDRVLLDQRPPQQGVDGALLLSPGTHALTVERKGYQPLQRALQVSAGQHSRVDVRLEPVGQVALGAAATAAAPRSQDPKSDHNLSRTLGVVSLSLGASALLASGITAALALDRRAALGRKCPNNACPPEHHGALDVYNRFKTVSTIAFYTGLAAGTAGLVLLLLDDEQQAPHSANTAHLQLHAGPLGLHLEGTL